LFWRYVLLIVNIPLSLIFDDTGAKEVNIIIIIIGASDIN